MSDGTIPAWRSSTTSRLVRAGFRMVIDSQADLEVALEAGDGEQAVRALDPAARMATRPVDVVLMDVACRRWTGDGDRAVASVARARRRTVRRRVIVLTTFDLDEYVLSAIRAGASGVTAQGRPTRGDAGGHPHGARRVTR